MLPFKPNMKFRVKYFKKHWVNTFCTSFAVVLWNNWVKAAHINDTGSPLDASSLLQCLLLRSSWWVLRVHARESNVNIQLLLGCDKYSWWRTQFTIFSPPSFEPKADGRNRLVDEAKESNLGAGCSQAGLQMIKISIVIRRTLWLYQFLCTHDSQFFCWG